MGRPITISARKHTIISINDVDIASLLIGSLRFVYCGVFCGNDIPCDISRVCYHYSYPDEKIYNNINLNCNNNNFSILCTE